MTEGKLSDFYAVCDGPHREFFSTIMRDWSEIGLQRDWQDGNAVLCVRTAGRSEPIFILSPADSSHRAQLKLPLESIRGALGEIEVQRLQQEFKDIHGLKIQMRNACVEIANPGHASGPMQQAIRNVITKLGVRLPNILAP